MGKGNGSYRRTILELVLVTGIFAIVSAFLIQFYMKADRLQEKAVAISSGTLRAESLAETIKGKGIAKAVQELGMEKKEGYYILHYDKKWQVAKDADTYQMILVEPENSEVYGTVSIAQIYVGSSELETELTQKPTVSEDLILCHLQIGFESEMGE